MTHACRARKRNLETAQGKALNAPRAGQKDKLAPAMPADATGVSGGVRPKWLVSSID
jgi:hypothetical protein